MPKKYTVDDEMNRVVGALESVKPETEQYGVMVGNLEVLARIKDSKSKFHVSGDQILSAVTSIVGILLVLNFEKLDNISSKAFGMVWKR